MLVDVQGGLAATVRRLSGLLNSFLTLSSDRDSSFRGHSRRESLNRLSARGSRLWKFEGYVDG